MAQQPKNLASWIVTLVAFIHLIGVVIATLCLNWFGDWEHYSSGLLLTRRILWGVWVIHALAAILTRVTLFGWSFRRYFRLDENGSAQQLPVRPTRAPWYKSGKVSFSTTLILVSLLGTCAITTAVLYILKDETGDWAFWLAIKIIWSSWWVLTIITVLVRLALFGAEKKKRVIENNATTPRAPAQPVPTSPPDKHDSSEVRS